jgi:hypothetical protein
MATKHKPPAKKGSKDKPVGTVNVHYSKPPKKK